MVEWNALKIPLIWVAVEENRMSRFRDNDVTYEQNRAQKRTKKSFLCLAELRPVQAKSRCNLNSEIWPLLFSFLFWTRPHLSPYIRREIFPRPQKLDTSPLAAFVRLPSYGRDRMPAIFVLDTMHNAVGNLECNSWCFSRNNKCDEETTEKSTESTGSNATAWKKKTVFDCKKRRPQFTTSMISNTNSI